MLIVRHQQMYLSVRRKDGHAIPHHGPVTRQQKHLRRGAADDGVESRFTHRRDNAGVPLGINSHVAARAAVLPRSC